MLTVTKMNAFEKTNYKCAHCGCTGKSLTVEHIFPQSLFPNDSLKNHEYNTTILCKECNASKGDTLISPLEFKNYYSHINKKYIGDYYDFYIQSLWKLGIKRSFHIKVERSNVTSENEQLKNLYEKEKNENQALKGTITALKTANEQLKRELRQNRNDLKQNMYEHEWLKNRVSHLESTISEMFKKVFNLKQQEIPHL